MKDEAKVQQGIEASKIRWEPRYKALEILRSKYGKREFDQFLKWKTEHLIELVKWIKT